MRLHDFRVLSFACYGTMIDSESGLYEALQPLLMRGGPDLPREAVLEAFAQQEASQQAETPTMPYSRLLAAVHARLADEWGLEPDEALDRRFAHSVADWPPFADSAAALAYLKQHYTLVVLTDADASSFAHSRRQLGIAFDAVFTAEEAGGYKPQRRGFDLMLARLAEKGHGRDAVLHVARSLFHDHAPAKRAGLATAWIDRAEAGDGAAPPASGAGYEFRFPSLAAMAKAHQAEAMA